MNLDSLTLLSSPPQEGHASGTSGCHGTGAGLEGEEFLMADTMARREYARRWRAANKEKVQEHNHKYRERHHKKVLECNRKWRQEHHKKVLKYVRHWRAANRHKCRANDNRYRARIQGAPGQHTTDQWLARVDYHGWRCRYCQQPLTDASLVKEHAIPLSRGGSNWPGNLVPSCKSCNSQKNNRTFVEFAEQAYGQAAIVPVLPG